MGGGSSRRVGGNMSWRRSRILKWSGLLSSVILAVTLATLSLPESVLPASGANATAVLSGYNTTTFGANDDGSYPCTSPDNGTPPGCTPTTVPIGFPIDFFGTTYSSLYVNNNGNLTFNAPLAGYTPFGLAGTSSVIIAPFFADVDTRVGNQVTFGTGTVNGHPSFGVTWPGVGCYQENDSVTDDFQAVLIDRSDIAPGDFDIEYNYNQIQWDAGEASGGNSMCQSSANANAAAVGYSNGTGAAGTNFELAGSQTDGALLSTNAATGLTNNDLNPNADAQGAGVLGRYIFEVRAGTPLNPTTLTTSLTGGTQHGATISVPPGTATTDLATIGGASSTAGGTVTYTVYSDAHCTTEVASGGTQAVTNDVAAPSSAVTLSTPGTYYWQASYSGDPANDPSTSTCGAEVESVVNPVALSVSKTVSPNPYVPGSPLTYTITVSNAGPGTATGTAVSDPLPAALAGGGFTWTCAAAPGSTCGAAAGTGSVTDAPTIASGGSVVYTVTGTVPSAASGTISNTATVTPPANATDPGCSPSCSSTATDPEAAPALSLTKTASVTSVSASGATFTYDFAVQDTGNTNLSNIAIHDTQAAPSSSSNLTNLNCPDSSLTATSGTETCTATYTVSQADIDAGSINDTATATGTFGTSTITSNPSSASVTATQAGAITITKSASASSVSAPGPVTYTFSIQNTGNVSLSGATISDSANFSGLSALSCAGGETNGSITLAPGASETCTATESVTQAQIDAGTTLTDTASVTATPPASDTSQTSVTATSGQVTVSIAQTPGLSVAKTASVSSVSASGQTFTYTFAVQNTGNTDEYNVNVADAQAPPSRPTNLGAIGCPNTSSTPLAPGATENCTALYTVSQSDMDAGSISDMASASGNSGSPTGSTQTSAPSSATVSAAEAGAITIAKTADVASVSAPGTVTYTFTIKNTGNVDLTGATISDNANFSGLSALSCAGGESNGSILLAPGASETCTATESVTQAQIDAGTTLSDTGSVTALPPRTDTTQTSVSATSGAVNVTVTQTPGLSVLKTASVSSVSAANQTFTYTFAVQNTGNTDEYNVNVADAQTLPSVAANLGPISCPDTSSTPLAPGATENCMATYTVSQADMNAGSINDTATATGNSGSPGGPSQTSPGAGASVAATQSGSILVLKVSSVSSVSAPGPVTYTFTLTNNGNVDLTGATITDNANFSGLSALTCAGGETNGSISLGVGASETCTATESVTQAQIDAGTTLSDTGSVTASTPASDTSEPSVTATSSEVDVTITQSPSLQVVKSASTSAVTAAGQAFTYTFAVTNNGNVTESNIGITDTQTSPSVPANLGPISCPPGSLAPATTENCTASYTVSQADMDNGSINDSAVATGTAPDGSTTTSPSSGASVTATQAGAITIAKTANVASVSAPGTVTYTFTVKNTGNVDLSGATISDNANFSGLSALSCAGGEANGSIALSPGDSETCTATESVTQAQIDAGTTLTDTASVTATPPASDAAQASVGASSAQVNVTVTQTPGLSVVKTASVSSVSASGQTFTYTFAVKNTGNTDLSSIAIDDVQSAPSVSANVTTPMCPDSTLAPGAGENCTATYTVSQADMDAGSISDTATATGTLNAATITSNSSAATVSATQSPAISLSKTASGGPVHTPGSTVTYTFSLSNTGNVTLGNVGVTDKQAAPALNSGLSAITCVSGTNGPAVTNGSISLAPGGTATCTATYTATAADIANGVISDTATANGNSALGQAVSATSSASVVASAPIMTGEANDATVAVGLLGNPLPVAVFLHDTGAVATAKASTTATPCAVGLSLVDLVLSGDVCSDVTTVPATNLTPATSTASASVAAVAIGVPLLPVITLSAVQSSSTTTCLGSLGSTTIAYLKVGSTVVISKPTVIAPNTTLTIGLVTLVLNQQVPLTGADHGLIVSAVDVRANVLGLVQANVSVASSESDIENC